MKTNQVDEVTINISEGYNCIIDTASYDLVKNYNWRLHSQGYAATKVKGRTVLMHRLLTGFPKADVDHKNLNKLDNRMSNLRVCSRSKNKANTKKKKGDFSSKFKGVDWREDCKKWRATIRVNYKKIHLGMFSKEIDAAKAYNEAAIKHFGSYARLNDVVTPL